MANLRSSSVEIICRELRPYLERAIEIHPNPVDIRIVRGRPATVRDYVRRLLIKARAEGIGKFTAQQVCALKPRIRVYFCSGGISLAGIDIKYKVPIYWDNYQFPFKLLPQEDARWTTLAIKPSPDELLALIRLLNNGVIESPIEVRGNFTRDEITSLLRKDKIKGIKVFKIGRNMMLWPPQKEDK